MSYHVCLKKVGDKKCRMLGSKGATRLRVHAVQFEKQAEAEKQAAYVQEHNPGWTAWVRPIPAGRAM